MYVMSNCELFSKVQEGPEEKNSPRQFEPPQDAQNTQLNEAQETQATLKRDRRAV